MLNPKRFRLGRTGLGLCLALLAGVIFVADTYTDLEIAVAVLYVTVILVSAAAREHAPSRTAISTTANSFFISIILSRGLCHTLSDDGKQKKFRKTRKQKGMPLKNKAKTPIIS